MTKEELKILLSTFLDDFDICPPYMDDWDYCIEKWIEKNIQWIDEDQS